MKKLLAILSAAAMLIGMMGTVAMAADTTVVTYNNATSIVFSPKVTWSNNSKAGKYATVTNMDDTYFILTPSK